MSKILIANWKSNPNDLQTAIKLARSTDYKNVVIAPPFTFLIPVGQVLKKAALGAQNIFWSDGPYTGEISAKNLKTLKVQYVIIGHSERRNNLKESDEIISRKVKTAIETNLKTILCVGEPAAIREKGLSSAQKFVKKQLLADLKLVRRSNKLGTGLIIAYEPVWAISTNRGSQPDTPQNSVKMIVFIKNLLYSTFNLSASKVLYGGSVTAKNAKGFLSQKEIDGALVGGASLRPLEFRQIISSI